MAFERIADRKIREAMREGRFDGLANQGQPLDLEEYFKLPVELRLAYSVLKSAGCLPEEVERLNEIARLEQELAATGDEARRAELRKTLERQRLAVTLALERARRR